MTTKCSKNGFFSENVQVNNNVCCKCCKSVFVTCSGETRNKLSRVSCTKFLGVIVDDSLTWTNHTSNVANTLSKYCGIMYRLKNVLPSEALLSLYNTLVLPHLTLLYIIWGDSNYTNLHLIYYKQKKIVRICANSHWLTHSSPLFKKLNILTIYDIHKLIIGLLCIIILSINSLLISLIISLKTMQFTTIQPGFPICTVLVFSNLI